jgi:hypothetical protein
VLIAILIAALIGWGLESHRRQLKRGRLSDRNSIPVDTIVSKHFDDAEKHAQLIYWWNEVSKTLKLDARKLRPDDRFDKELAPVEGFITEDETIQLNDLIDDLGLSQVRLKSNKTLDTIAELVEFLAMNAET